MGINELIEKYSLPSSPAEAHYTVYKLTDPEGKVYIGCTGKPVEQRWGRAGIIIPEAIFLRRSGL